MKENNQAVNQLDVDSDKEQENTSLLWGKGLLKQVIGFTEHIWMWNFVLGEEDNWLNKSSETCMPEFLKLISWHW